MQEAMSPVEEGVIDKHADAEASNHGPESIWRLLLPHIHSKMRKEREEQVQRKRLHHPVRDRAEP